MSLGLRRTVTLLAIYTVALHGILLGLAPIAVTASGQIDPFAVICHSLAPAIPDDETPDKTNFIPGDACEHCNLCSAVAAPSAPDLVVFDDLLPTRLLQVLHPASTAPGTGVEYRPNLARGPPLFV